MRFVTPIPAKHLRLQHVQSGTGRPIEAVVNEWLADNPDVDVYGIETVEIASTHPSGPPVPAERMIYYKPKT
jgi:hypothetical protein